MLKYLSLFFLYVISITLYFYFELQMKHEVGKKNYAIQTEISYMGSINTYEVLSDRFYGTYTNLISKKLSIANGATLKTRDHVREALLKDLSKFFGELKLIGFNGMHIIDKEGYSLLRLHKPYEYDDNIIERRASLKKLKKDILYQRSYEAGLFAMSYRFQYPLFYDGEFVGICEFNLKPNTVLENLKTKKDYQILALYKDAYLQKVLQNDILHDRYKSIKLLEKNFYYNKSESILPLEEIGMLNSNKTTVFNYHYNSNWHIIAVIPTFDIIGEHIGYILIDKIDYLYPSLIQDITKKYILFLLIGLVVLFFYLKQRKILQYNRELINLQNDILVVTSGKKILDVNKKMLNFFGYKDLDSFTNKHSCICDHFIKEEGYLYKTMGSMDWITYIQKNQDTQILVKMYDKRADKENIFEIEYLPFKDNERFFLIFKDVTEKFYKEKELLSMAYIDPLTKIYNRRSFNNLLEAKYEKAKRGEFTFSLIMLDIDHFKNINDTYGHNVGDVVLKELSELISSKIREYDTFARWGGEEFMVLATLDVNATKKLAQKLKEEIEHFNFSVTEKITISLGVAQYKKTESIESLIKRVDELLYKAKENGRNRVES